MKAIGRCLGPLVAALVLTLAVTWPLAACLGRCIPPPPDSILTVYFLAWAGHALTTPGVRLLDAPMFAPYPHTLPVDLAPGARHVTCVDRATGPAPLHGSIEDGQTRHTFVVVPGQPAVRPRREGAP
jgi:hypothetical protein